MERFIREIRRGTKVRDHKFPSEEAVYKLLYLGHGRQPVSWVGEASCFAKRTSCGSRDSRRRGKPCFLTSPLWTSKMRVTKPG